MSEHLSVAAVRGAPSAKPSADAFSRALASVQDLCARTSTKFGGDAKSQLLWFAVLDWIVAQQQSLPKMELGHSSTAHCCSATNGGVDCEFRSASSHVRDVASGHGHHAAFSATQHCVKEGIVGS